MKPRERLFASLMLEEPDTVPVSVRINSISEPWLAQAGVLDHLMKVSDVLTSGHVSDEGSFCLTSAAKPDVAPVQGGAGLLEFKIETPKGDLTCLTRETIPGRPYIGSWVVKPYLENDQDIERLIAIPYAPPVLNAEPFLRRKDRIGDQGIVYAGLRDPVGILSSLFSLETFLMLCMRKIDLVKELLDIFLYRILDILDRSFQLGVGPLYEIVGPEMVSPTFLPPLFFGELVVRYDKRIVETIHAHGGVALMHCHGKVDRVLESFREMKLDAVHPIEPPPFGNVNLADAKKRIGCDVCMRGNIQAAILDSASPLEIEDLCRRAIRDAAAGGGFILEPTSTPLPNTPIQNLCAFIESARKHGSGCRK